MTQELEETFGKDFVDNFQEQVQARRRERNRISDEQKAAIAHEAVNNAKFKQGDPAFQYKTENGITHDVLLMMLPDPDGEPIWNRVNKLDSGAVTCPLDYMGQWWNCLFNNPEDLERMNPGDYYIVIGEQSIWEADSGQEYEQVSPVRGVISLPEAQKLAEAYLDENTQVNEEGSGVVEETAESEEEEESIPTDTSEDEEEDTEEEEPKRRVSFGSGSSSEEDEEEEDDDDEGGSIFDDDEEEEEEPEPSLGFEPSDVHEQVEALAQKDGAVWEVEEGDERLRKLVQIIGKRLDVDVSSDEVAVAIRDASLERIRAERDDDTDEDDDLFE